jgi:hypothetical protein
VILVPANAAVSVIFKSLLGHDIAGHLPTSQDLSKFRVTVGLATKEPEVKSFATACLKEMTAACFKAASESDLK